MLCKSKFSSKFIFHWLINIFLTCKIELAYNSIGVFVHENPRLHIYITCGDSLYLCSVSYHYTLSVNNEVLHTSTQAVPNLKHREQIFSKKV